MFDFGRDLPLPQALVAALEQAHGTLKRELDREVARHRLTPPQFAVLALLGNLGARPLSLIAQELRVSAGNVTCVVDNLEKAGLVARERDIEDRRVIDAYLTDAGKECLAAVRPAYEARIQALTRDLTPDEQEILARLLRKLTASAGGKV